MTGRRLGLWAFCWLSAIAALAADVPKSGSQKADKPKRRVNPPTIRDVDNAFQGKTEQPLLNLYGKLQRADAAADKPELVAALVKGLQKRFDKQQTVGADLQLITLLGRYTCEEAEAGLKSFYKSEDVRVLIVVLRAMAEGDCLPEWPDVLTLTEREDYDAVFALRRGVVNAAERDGSPDAVDFLIETVSDADGQLKYEAAKSLTELTGQKFGGQGNQWSKWWQTAREGFVPIARNRRIGGSLKNTMLWNEPVPRFYRLPIYAKRVLFMIDRSGSMMLLDDNGESRIDRARRELEMAIENLPPETEFDIVAFHDSVTAFAPRLVTADFETKRQAILFSRNLVAAKDTNCYDALSLALAADPNLEAIYFLSDGVPTTGGIVEPPKIVDAVSLQNLLHVTAIYTLGIDAVGEHETFLKHLAERNYGEYFSIR